MLDGELIERCAGDLLVAADRNVRNLLRALGRISVTALTSTRHHLRRLRHRLHLLDVLGQHRGRAAEARLVRRAEAIGDIAIEPGQRALARQEVRHVAAFERGLRRLLAGWGAMFMPGSFTHIIVLRM